VHHSDDFGLDQAHGFNFDTADDQDVEWVVVVTVGPGDEAVVLRVMHCAEEDTIQLKEAAVLVQLVLNLALSWNLDDSVNELRRIFAIGHTMPWILHEQLLVMTHK
jgi:hypothetical protein